jgi:hypothetical protein
MDDEPLLTRTASKETPKASRKKAGDFTGLWLDERLWLQ